LRERTLALIVAAAAEGPRFDNIVDDVPMDWTAQHPDRNTISQSTRPPEKESLHPFATP
jgi:hypothetical protein